MSKPVILGGAVRAIREAKAATDNRFKLGQFAAACLMSTSHLCNVEAGRKFPPEDVIERIATQLGVPAKAISYRVSQEAAS